MTRKEFVKILNSRIKDLTLILMASLLRFGNLRQVQQAISCIHYWVACGKAGKKIFRRRETQDMRW